MASRNAERTPGSGPEVRNGDGRWAAVERRDKTADGRFVNAAKRTRLYGNPSSASHKPTWENVEFFATPAEAEAAVTRPAGGGRARRTVKLPKSQQAAAIAKACRLIERADRSPDLKSLAAHVAMSPSHFHRVFKAETGVTPKAYASAHRARRLREQLSGCRKVTEAIYDAGFNSNSRLYEEYYALLGMRPQDYRKGGRNAEIRFAIVQASLGTVLVAMSQWGVCAIDLGNKPEDMVRELENQFPTARVIGTDPEFECLIAQVIGMVESPNMGLNLPPDIRGTAFKHRIWQALREFQHRGRGRLC